MEYENEQRSYEDEPQYRERSRSPRPDRDGDTRLRSASPRGDRDRTATSASRDVPDEAPNEGSNLFVTGIAPRLNESEVERLFSKYGDVESCSIMRDPHTRESRGFGFVKMVTSDQADAAKNGLNGEVYEGRTLSIEKARRSRPRTPTPGKYFGPPKRDDRSGGGRGGGRGGFRDRYDDRGYGRRYDDRGYGGGGGYRDRYDDRGYGGGGYGGGGRRDRDDYGSSRSYRDDRGGERGGDRGDRSYGGGREERRGGGGGGSYGGGSYERAPRGAASTDAYADSAAAPARGGYEDDRYARR